MTKSELQRARLDLLIAYCGAVVQAEMKSEIDFGANLEYHRESMKDVFAPAFEYLETLEANADYGPLKACDICGGEIKAEWDKMHKAESCAGDIVKKVADLPPADRGEVTASIAPHFKKEISRVCVETGRPLSEWAIGTAIDSESDLQRARLDLLAARARAATDLQCAEVQRNLTREHNRETAKLNYAPAFEYLETLEANADYGPLKACDICGGEIKAEWDKMHKAESCAGDIVKKLADLPPADRGEFTASLAPHFKKELSRVCVETGKQLSAWAIGTAIDWDGTVFEFSERPYLMPDKRWNWPAKVNETRRSQKLGRVNLADRDPSTTWREYR